MLAQEAVRRAAALADRYGDLGGEALLRPLIAEEFVGRVALLSSFGTEAALLLDMVARIDRTLPILFIDTGKLFAETHAYRATLTARLGLTEIRIVTATPAAIATIDPEADLWARDVDACCAVRKVEPLRAARRGYDCLISGRKRHHGGLRSFLRAFEADDGIVKVDPLVSWSRERIADEFAARDLPPHPLQSAGYLSVGCTSCTALPKPGPDFRSGRWAGSEKTECGIHNGRRIAALETSLA